jgi:hypothetical protein
LDPKIVGFLSAFTPLRLILRCMSPGRIIQWIKWIKLLPWIGFSNWPVSRDQRAAFEGSD